MFPLRFLAAPFHRSLSCPFCSRDAAARTAPALVPTGMLQGGLPHDCQPPPPRLLCHFFLLRLPTLAWYPVLFRGSWRGNCWAHQGHTWFSSSCIQNRDLISYPGCASTPIKETWAHVSCCQGAIKEASRGDRTGKPWVPPNCRHFSCPTALCSTKLQPQHLPQPHRAVRPARLPVPAHPA